MITRTCQICGKVFDIYEDSNNVLSLRRFRKFIDDTIINFCSDCYTNLGIDEIIENNIKYDEKGKNIVDL